MESAQANHKVAQKMASYHAKDEKTLTRELKQVEKDMLIAAKNLEFERAAELRDELKRLKSVLFGAAGHDEI
jgi:excinuclease ABC subunit B